MEPPHCALTFIVRLTLIRCRTLVLMLFMLATLHRTAWGDDIAWKNPVSGNWGTPSNWNPAQVPDAADNAIITVSGTYTVTLDVTATVTAVNLGGASGTQTLAIGANTLTLTGPSTVDTHGVRTMSGGVLSGGDALTVNGAFNWTGGTQSGTGTTTIGATGTLTIGGEVGLQRRVINNGTTVWSAGRVGVLNGTFINNNAFSAESDDNFDNFGGSNAFNNTGTFTKSTGAGPTAFNIPFNNSGTVNVNSGTLVLNAGGGGTGSFVLAPGKTLRFAGGTHELTAGAVMGAGVVQFSGGTVNLGATYDIGGSTTVNGGTVSFTGMVTNVGNPLTLSSGILSGSSAVPVTGAFNWTGGTQSGTGTTTIGATGTLTIDGEVGLQRRVINNGTTVWSAGRIGAQNGTFINNNAFSAEGDDSVADFGGSNGFNNTGTLTKSPGAGSTTVNIPFNNSGTVNLNSGTLRFGSSFIQAAGATHLRGGSLASSGTLDTMGGVLDGSGNVTGALSNGGNLSPGASPGEINLIGNYNQAASGVLSIDLNGLAAGTEFDQLAVVGAVTLSGRLNVSVGFTPATGATFTIIDNDGTDAVTETFKDLPEGAPVSVGGRSLQISYVGGTGNDVVLTVAGATTVTPTQTPASTASPAPTGTNTGAPSPTSTGTITAPASPTPTATPVRPPCVGDCNRNFVVAINELVTGVNIALGSIEFDRCPAFDTEDSMSVQINELITGVNNALNGCP